MRILIAEDDFSSRSILLRMLSDLGECEIAMDGEETYKAYQENFGTSKAYNLLCLDIVMPKIDGQQVLNKIRTFEKEKRVDPNSSLKVIMTTALSDSETVIDSFKNGCEGYIVKPISKKQLLSEISRLGFEIY